MPIYEYKCEKGHVFETVQRMADDTLTECEVCEAPVQRVFHPIAVHFKGSGFYTTDYANKKPESGSDSDKGSSGSDSSDSKSSDSSDSTGSSDSKSSDSKSSDSKSSDSSGSADKAKSSASGD